MFDLEALGITKEELQNRVVDRIANKLLTTGGSDEEGEWMERDSDFKRKLEKRIQETIDAGIDALAQRCILPNVVQMMESVTLQRTNEWGERKGEPVTFIEYLAQRADAYLREEVNYEGKARAENGNYGSWSASGTRVAVLINKHLHYSIETAMKQALGVANKSIVGGLEQAVKVALASIQTKLEVTIK